MTSVETARNDANKQRADIAAPLEGLRDYARLNLHNDTRLEVEASIVFYERRDLLLAKFVEAADILLLEGYPALDPRPISISAMDDLKGNKSTIDAALGTFVSNEATNLGLAAGEKAPK